MSEPCLTLAQRRSSKSPVDGRIAALQAQITTALRQSDDPNVIRLSNQFEATDDAAVTDLEIVPRTCNNTITRKRTE